MYANAIGSRKGANVLYTLNQQQLAGDYSMDVESVKRKKKGLLCPLVLTNAADRK